MEQRTTPGPAWLVQEASGGLKTPHCPSGVGFVPEARPGSGVRGVGTPTRAHTRGHAHTHPCHGGTQPGPRCCPSSLPQGREQPVASGALVALAPGRCGLTQAVPAVSLTLLPVPPLPRPRQPGGCSRLFLWELGRKTRFAAPARCQPSPCHRLCRGHLCAWPCPGTRAPLATATGPVGCPWHPAVVQQDGCRGVPIVGRGCPPDTDCP